MWKYLGSRESSPDVSWRWQGGEAELMPSEVEGLWWVRAEGCLGWLETHVLFTLLIVSKRMLLEHRWRNADALATGLAKNLEAWVFISVRYQMIGSKHPLRQVKALLRVFTFLT